METGKLLTEGVDFYYNEAGFIVFTEKYHLEKGYCCGHGCKHCPYPKENNGERTSSGAKDFEQQ